MAKKGARKVGSTLKKFATFHEAKVLSDLTLEKQGKEYHIDFLLIGYFGMLAVKVCDLKGDIYGEEKSTSWSLHFKDEINKVENACEASLAELDAIRYRLSKHQVFNIPMEYVVVFTQKKTVVNVAGVEQLITPKELSKYIDRSKYLKDNGVDVDKVVAILQDNA